MLWENYKYLIDDAQTALFQGNPPLFYQLVTVTLIFIAIRLWQRFRTYHNPNKLPGAIDIPPLTFAYFGIMIALSFGALDTLRGIYENYVLVALRNIG